MESEFYTYGEGRPDVVTRLCMVVDWCIDHPEYTAKIKVIPKKDLARHEAQLARGHRAITAPQKAIARFRSRKYTNYL